MALDGAFLACLRRELILALPDARIDKIHQPGKEELVFSLRHKNGTDKLLLSARTQSPRVHITRTVPENPAAPPMFCMLLRKLMTGGRLAELRQPDFERMLTLDFDCMDEFGQVTRLSLVCELMGRNSNIILVDQSGLVVDAVRRVDLSMSPDRPILPGLPYNPPPRPANRLDAGTHTAQELTDAILSAHPQPLDQAITSSIMGLSPLVCREISHLTTRGRDTISTELSPDERDKLRFTVGRVQEAALTGQGCRPYLLADRQGVPMDFCFLPITQYGLQACGRAVGSFSELLDVFYTEKDAALRMRQRSADILKLLSNASARLTRKLENQRREWAASENRDQHRLFGDLIIASASAIPKGASKAEVPNYYDPDCTTVTVPLNPALSAAENAQRYYKLYRKAKTAREVLIAQIENGERELSYLDTVFDALSRAKTYAELGELRAELAAGGYLRAAAGKQKSGKPKSSAPAKPLTFRSTDGYTILVGRNNLQNDALTLRTAEKNDLWFHVKGMPGSHTVLLTQGSQPPDSTLEQAAMLAALHSKAAASAQVPVDYTRVRHVKKSPGAKPGMVTYDHQTTVYVTPDKTLTERLKE